MSGNERFSEKDLLGKGYVQDENGNWKPATTAKKTPMLPDKALIQPAQKRIALTHGSARVDDNCSQETITILNKLSEIAYTHEPMRTITLNLFGEPMPKQSVRGYATGRRNDRGTLIVDHFQPQKTVDRKKDYHRQIAQQLPKDFKLFTEVVHIRKLHFIFSPLKQFHKVKGKMEAIRNGQIFYKTTRPDIDNYFKLLLDSLTEKVFSDDSIIVSIDDSKKYFGTGGCVIITLEGK